MADVVNTNQFKTGMAIAIDGQPFTIVDFQHVKPGKGGAFVRTKVRNIATGAVLDKTFRAGEKFDRMHTQSRKVAYLYSTEDEVVLMDNETYEQVSVSPAMAQDALKWVVENMEVELMYLNGQPFEVAAPNFVELTITQSDPGVQGNTAQGATKPATLESGVIIQVPLFIEEGEKVKVDTRSGEYLGRA
ncbi:MAG TPA: elongation factor P [Thermoleophilia bacterium]|nr:elongation factor P [Thermoleophilia bacterium]